MKYVFLIAFILISGSAYAETVTISLLSKTIAQMEKSKIPAQITLTPAEGSSITDSFSGRRINAKEIKLRFSGRWTLEADRPYDSLSVQIEGTEMLFSDAGETRRYPLPARITLSKGKLSIVVDEDVSRYAVDSASAELGAVTQNEHEALAALSMVILARCRSNGGKVLSDLTYDQIYRGRICSNFVTVNDSGWEIDSARLKGELLFHSQSGGRTFSQSIFSGRSGGFPGVEDRLPFLGIRLGVEDTWNRYLSYAELSLFCKRTILSEADFTQYYRRAYPEAFRLAVNRVKGWNFIRSNNFTYSEGDNGIVFSGSGLGHGCGLSQKGALTLARLGFSRFEILQHYYPGIAFKNTGGKIDYNVSYVLFDLSTGQVLTASNDALADRKIPPGSFSKIFSSLAFLSGDAAIARRQYRCSGRDSDVPFPCWDTKGHGIIAMDAALYNSCNLYFASLCNSMPYERFYSRAEQVALIIGMKNYLPESADKARYMRLVCGLDFSVQSSVGDMMKLISFTAGYGNTGLENEREFLREALRKTLIEGTGKNNGKKKTESSEGVCGKTSTVIYGTNTAVGYGMFAGWKGGRGIVVLMRKATGHDAAQWAKQLLR